MQTRATFIDGVNGRLFLLERHCPGTRGHVLFVPPFAEEMNKCRRLMTVMAESLAARNISSLYIDPFGTGDSDGDFANATWSKWRADLASTNEWCVAQGKLLRGIVAVRLGAALALAALRTGQLPAVASTVLVQPTFDCKRNLQQFLRLRSAAGMSAGLAAETATEQQKCLAREGHLDVAGYRLSRQMADELASEVQPQVLPAAMGRITWVEIVRDAASEISDPTRKLVDRSAAAGRTVRLARVCEAPFWTATEITAPQSVVDELADICI